MNITYTIKVCYGPHSRPLVHPDVPPGGEQSHDRLDAAQAKAGAEAFLRDLFQFHGAGVSSITVTAVREEG